MAATDIDTAGRWGLGIALTALGAAMLVAIFHASATQDEFYTLFVARPGLPFMTGLLDYWLKDNHPPFFYALSWATSWLGDGPEPRRLVNLPIFALVGFGLIVLARKLPSARPTFLLFAIGLTGMMPAVEKAAELRSYFAGLGASILTVAALFVYAAAPGDAQPGRKPPLALVLILTLAFNIHYVNTLILGSMAAAFVVHRYLGGDRAAAGRLFAACAIAAVPFAAFLIVQFRVMETSTAVLWINPDPVQALRTMLSAVKWALLADVALAATGLAGLALLARDSRRAGALDPRLDFCLTLAAGAIAALAMLMALHLWRPIVVFRYLLPLFPAIIMALAIGTAALLPRLGRRPALVAVALISLAALAGIAGGLRYTLARANWYDSGRLIGTEVRRCPGTLVHANQSWDPRQFGSSVVPDLPLAYNRVARRFGFRIEPQGSRRMAAGCPTIFWSLIATKPVPDRLTARLRSLGYAPGTMQMHRVGQTWFAVSRP